MSPTVSFDLFPARVTLPSGMELTPARVFVIDGRVEVYIVQDGNPKLFYERELASHEGNARNIALQVPEGVVRAVKDAGDCGCGNPLRSFNPRPGERRVRGPL